MAEPVPVIPLDYAPPADPVAGRRARRWRFVVRACAVLAAATCVAATALIAFASVESVLATGPVLFVVGLLMVVGAFKQDDLFGWVLGLCHCFVCALFLGLVHALGWGPDDAAGPFLAMRIAYTPVAVAATLAFLLRRRG